METKMKGRLVCRTTPSDKTAFKQLSQHRGVTISNLVRSWLQQEYQKEFGQWPPAGQGVERG